MSSDRPWPRPGPGRAEWIQDTFDYHKDPPPLEPLSSLSSLRRSDKAMAIGYLFGRKVTWVRDRGPDLFSTILDNVPYEYKIQRRVLPKWEDEPEWAQT